VVAVVVLVRSQVFEEEKSLGIWGNSSFFSLFSNLIFLVLSYSITCSHTPYSSPHLCTSFDIGAKCETLSKASKQSKSERDTKKLQKPAKLRAE
jgi:hypothetical protein